MAKWTFEDYANGAMAVAGAVVIGINIYEAHKLNVDFKHEKIADRYIDETRARMSSMHEHILNNHGSKETYVEAFTAAKNVISFDISEDLAGNNYQHKVQEVIFAYIDDLIATV